MNKEYWDNFYKSKRINSPTSFVKFCSFWLNYNNIKDINQIYDFGCGNGRDTVYWMKNHFSVIGIDQSYKKKPSDQFILSNTDIMSFISEKQNTNNDIVYSRFFLHSIDWETILNLLSWTKGYFMAEFRLVGDKPIIYPTHKRNLINPFNLQSVLLAYGFKIFYYIEDRDLAVYGKENPLIGRVIAKKLIGD